MCNSQYMLHLVKCLYYNLIFQEALNQQIKIERNPFMYPIAAFKAIIKNHRNAMDKPKLTLELHDYLHPSLIEVADFLEYVVFYIMLNYSVYYDID